MASLANGVAPEPSDSGATPLVRLRNVGRRYGPVVALQGVTLDLVAGEVHCLAGENGAGKSTVIKVLTGAVSRSSGDYEVNGSAVPVQVTPTQIRDMGIGVVYQELSLFPELSVLDNLMMGQFANVGGVLRGGKNARMARSFLERVGLRDLPLRTLVEDLPTATRQLVEVARVLGVEARLVSFDEPTSALSERESEDLLTRIKNLRDQGVGVLYVTHRLEEMFEIGDRVSVLRDGILVETKSIDEYTLDTLVETMVGRPLESLYPGDRTRPGKPVLELKDLEVAGSLRRSTSPSTLVRSLESLGYSAPGDRRYCERFSVRTRCEVDQYSSTEFPQMLLTLAMPHGPGSACSPRIAKNPGSSPN